ncbi:MAG TPA: FAD-dependent oxidoreductase [Burkholderiales bacterium]|nr:FAD-dependent oxidoreductase [Burkholderiales bacterium]
MPKFAAKLIERNEVAEGTMAFTFERPSDFNFTAGQFLTVIVPNPPFSDAKGNRRTFSIASPPQELAHLEIATRMTDSALKRSLAELPLSTPVELFGPAGSFVLHKASSMPAVFIAGGIGITPFRSMINDAFARHLTHQITLVYSNRNLEGAAFHDEFLRAAEAHTKFKYIPTMTEANKSHRQWSGLRRIVDAHFLREHIGDIMAPVFYIAGPPGMVTGINKAVIEAGAEPARVRSEKFDGY